MASVLKIWNSLKGNYWFLPTTVVGLGVVLAYVMLAIDANYPTKYIMHLGWVYTRDPAGARALLAVTSQSMITVAGVVFSITTVALTFASNQFGTRVLRNFIHDTGNQIVFGVFLATFVYGLLVMRRVEDKPINFVPSLSVAVNIFLAAGSTLTLIYLIHHVIVSMESEMVVDRVATDLRATINNLFPEKLDPGEESQPHQEQELHSELPADFDERSSEIRSENEGFIGSVADEKLFQIAQRESLVIEVASRPGSFVFENVVLAKVWPRERLTEGIERKIRKAFDVKAQRTYQQDFGFALHQLVLLATRALSPALNALGTAMDSIDRVGAALALVGGRKIPSGRRYDEHHTLRLVASTWDVEQLADKALTALREAAINQPEVLQHMARVLVRSTPFICNRRLQLLVQHHSNECRQLTLKHRPEGEL